jgi:hypothetical protein
VDVDATHDLPAERAAEPGEHSPGQAAQLRRPRGRLRLDGELPVGQLDRTAVGGEFWSDERFPGDEDPSLGRGTLPPADLHQPGDQLTER